MINPYVTNYNLFILLIFVLYFTIKMFVCLTLYFKLVWLKRVGNWDNQGQ